VVCRRIALGLATGGGLGVLAAGLALGAEWFMVSPYGNTDAAIVEILVALSLLPAAGSAIVCALLALAPILRSKMLPLCLGSAAYCAVLIPLLPLSARIRIHAFDQLARRSRPLVAAILRYEAEHGRLTPGYITAVPATGMKAYPEYRYWTGEDAKHYRNNPWALEVLCSRGILNWDRFVYLPKGNYPRYDFGGSLERVQDWAYVWE
jgi:hypothetical protein